MKTGAQDIVTKLLRYTLFTFCVYYIIIYIGIVICRIQYPFELEWMEGGSVDHVSRILAGKRLYVSPSLEFIPYLYPPLYYYVSAPLAWMTGTGFLPLRMISFLSSLFSFTIIFLFVKRETGSLFSALTASGLFAAVFRISAAWYDTARVDSLFLCLLLLSIYLMRFRGEAKFQVLAGLLLGLAFLTKQTALFISLAVFVYCLVTERYRSVYFLGTAVATMAGASLLLDYVHEGWYNYYIFDLPRAMFAERLVRENYLGFWVNDLLFPLPGACILSISYLLSRHPGPDKKPRLFTLLFAGGMIAASFGPRLQIGSAANVLMPAYAALSVLFGLSVHSLLEAGERGTVSRSRLMRTGVYCIAIFQFGILLYNPVDQIPARTDLEAGRRLMDIVRETDGEILFPFHGYFGDLVPDSDTESRILDVVCPMSVINVLGYANQKAKSDLILEIQSAIRQRRFGAIILDKYWFEKDIEKYYSLERIIFEDEDVFWPVTGWQTRPEVIYVPRSDDG